MSTSNKNKGNRIAYTERKLHTFTSTNTRETHRHILSVYIAITYYTRTVISDEKYEVGTARVHIQRNASLDSTRGVHT